MQKCSFAEKSREEKVPFGQSVNKHLRKSNATRCISLVEMPSEYHSRNCLFS